MEKEAGWKMYIKLQELLELGLNKSQIARHLGIMLNTVKMHHSAETLENNKKN